jgi:hypothetical protein
MRPITVCCVAAMAIALLAEPPTLAQRRHAGRSARGGVQVD